MGTSEHERPRLLVIDDDPVMHRLFGNLLHQLGFEVLIANSGLAGLQMAAQHLPKLILLDYVMPDMDGLDTLKELKSSEKARNIPVLIVTGYLDPASSEQFMAAGAAACLAKPFEANVLGDLVKKLVAPAAPTPGSAAT